VHTTSETQTYANPALVLDDTDTTVVIGRTKSHGTQTCDQGAGPDRAGAYTVSDGQLELEEVNQSASKGDLKILR